MTEQVVAGAPPEGEGSRRRERPARVLVGWFNEEMAERALAAPGSPHPSADQSAWINSARAAIGSREVYQEPEDVIQVLPPSLVAYEERLRTSPSAAPYFNEGWTVATADLTKIVAMQPHVFIDRAADRIVGVTPEDLPAVAAVTLPFEGAVEIAVQGDESQQTWLISSNNPNLRVLGLHAGEHDGTAPPVFGFKVGAGASYVQVAKFRDRYILRDGYHRAVALVRAGATTVPVFFREFDTFEGLAPNGMLAQRAFLGDRPPFLPDYWDDQVSVEVAIPAGRKLIFLTARELTELT